MPDNDLWLKKIAAFLHDPPDKALWHNYRELDALRMWFWSVKLNKFPFYFVRMDFRKLSDKGLLAGASNLESSFNNATSISNWINYFRNPDNFKENEGLTFISVNVRKLQSKGELKNLFKREFHAVASSQLKNNLFGFEDLDIEPSNVILKHSLNPIDWLICDNLGRNKDALRRLLRKFFFTKLDSLSHPKIIFLKLWRLCPDLFLPSDTRVPDNTVRSLEVMQSSLATVLAYKIELDINFRISPNASQAIKELSSKGFGLLYDESQRKLILEVPIDVWKIREEIRNKGALQNNKDLQNLISNGLKNILRVHPSFLILEFGPVQKFIANAQKTRDLWFGSW
ncbi:MAG: type III-B CRISPR-associated protein Cas10/Cmr2, partial [Desulfonauticus sp.]|nr:type III-B CRISPR-associated protein Cas10/Cmr2 [Desulfonauticus sp.]